MKDTTTSRERWSRAKRQICWFAYYSYKSKIAFVSEIRFNMWLDFFLPKTGWNTLVQLQISRNYQRFRKIHLQNSQKLQPLKLHIGYFMRRTMVLHLLYTVQKQAHVVLTLIVPTLFPYEVELNMCRVLGVQLLSRRSNCTRIFSKLKDSNFWFKPNNVLFIWTRSLSWRSWRIVIWRLDVKYVRLGTMSTDSVNSIQLKEYSALFSHCRPKFLTHQEHNNHRHTHKRAHKISEELTFPMSLVTDISCSFLLP